MIAITAIFKEITFQKQRILKKENDITTPLYITRPLFQRVENPGNRRVVGSSPTRSDATVFVKSQWHLL